jgi:hypothetical protein
MTFPGARLIGRADLVGQSTALAAPTRQATLGSAARRFGRSMDWQGSELWSTIAKHSLEFSALIVLIAAIVAYRAVRLQQEMARGRAALDFFLKTETDDKVIRLYDEFKRIAPGLREAAFDDFIFTKECQQVRAFLNVCELIAVGVNEGVLSDRVAFAYWGDVLPESYLAAEPFIRFVRRRPQIGSPQTYAELEILSRKWHQRRIRN